MGFKRGALLLEWPEDSEFSGLEVRMRRLSIRQLLQVQGLADLRKNEVDTASAMASLLDAVGDGLLSWNYENEDGTPVPATREALDDVDMDMVLQLVRTWTSTAASVPLASNPSSPTGAPADPPDELASWMALSQESSPEPALS